MENASKALLISAGVLLIIILISIAFALLNSGSDVINRVDGEYDNISIAQYNKMFEKMSGTKLKYKEIKRIIAQVANNNYTYSQTGQGTEIVLIIIDNFSYFKDYHGLDINDALEDTKFKKAGKNATFGCNISYGEEGLVNHVVIRLEE